MFRWYVINTYSGHENKVKQNLEHRVQSLNVGRAVRQVVVPTETVQEMKDNQKVAVEKRTMPGYVLVNMDLNEDSWGVVKGTPGVTGFVGASNEPIPLTQSEVDRLLDKDGSRRRLGDERERTVLEDRDDHRDDRPLLVLGLGVERLAELHDVDAMLAQRRTDRRRRRGLAADGLELDGGEDLLSH